MRSLLALALLLTTSVFLEATPSVHQGAEWPNVVVSEGLEIPARDRENDLGWTLERLTSEYARVTGVHLMFTDSTLTRLDEVYVPLRHDMQVAVENVHRVVQSILIENGFVMSVDNESSPSSDLDSHDRGQLSFSPQTAGALCPARESLRLGRSPSLSHPHRHAAASHGPGRDLQLVEGRFR